jgi:general secretion pathway protein K
MSRGDTARDSGDGFILVAVLWILGGLGTLAAVYALYVVNAAANLAVDDERLQAEASISAAVELSAYYLSTVEAAERPTHGTFSFRVGKSEVAVTFRSEAARIDLNEAPKPLLAGLFVALGAEPEQASYYADRVIGWRTAATAANPDDDKEVTAYRNAGRNYNPRQGPFTHVQELWLVLGLPPPLVERALPLVTIFSGMPSVNVMDAAPQTLAALPGMTPDRLNAILVQREAVPGDARPVMQLLGPLQGEATVQGSKAQRVSVTVGLPKGRRVRAEVVFLPLDDAEDPYRILSWTDDFDGWGADEAMHRDAHRGAP